MVRQNAWCSSLVQTKTKEPCIGQEATLSQFCVARGIGDALYSATQASGLQLLLMRYSHSHCIGKLAHLQLKVEQKVLALFDNLEKMIAFFF